MRLMGIAREPDDRLQRASRALFRVDATPVANQPAATRVPWLRAGERIEPGWSVKAIEADAVWLVHNARETRMLLREPRGARAMAPPGATAVPCAAGTASSA